MKQLFIISTYFISLLAIANNKSLDVYVSYTPQNVIYSGQEIECKIQLFNTKSESNYEIIYYDNTEIIKRITNDTLTIHFKAGFRGINYNDSGQVEIPWWFKVREFSKSHDTIMKFSQKYFVNKPIAIFQSESPITAYYKKINIIKVDYPYYLESYFKPRGTLIQITNAEIISRNETEISFIPSDTVNSSQLSVFCGGNHVESRSIIYLPFLDPDITISTPYDKPQIKLHIDHPEYSNIKELIPKKGWFKVIRNGEVVYSVEHLKKINYQLKKQDILLLQIDEVDTVYEKNTKKIPISISKIITL